HRVCALADPAGARARARRGGPLMRDDQVRRYARHVMLPDVGGLGQTALMVATARVPLRESEPLAELVAATYLAAGGVGTVVVPSSTEAQRAEIAARGPDSHVVA